MIKATITTIITIFLLTVTSLQAYANASVEDIQWQDIAKKMDSPPPDKILFAWQIVEWPVWTKQSYAIHLIPDAYKTQKKKEDLRVFEARATFLISGDRSKLKRETLHHVEMITPLDPANKHEVLSTTPFRVKSTLYFPAHWAVVIETLKQAGQLKPSNQPYLEMTSTFGWIDNKTISSNKQLSEVIKKFRPKGGPPLAINVQEIYDLNEIAQFGNITSFFYPSDGDAIQVHVFTAFGLEKDVLSMGHQIGLTTEKVLLGEYTGGINTTSGIGAGLPQYMKELLANMAQQLRFTLGK